MLILLYFSANLIFIIVLIVFLHPTCGAARLCDGETSVWAFDSWSTVLSIKRENIQCLKLKTCHSRVIPGHGICCVVEYVAPSSQSYFI